MGSHESPAEAQSLIVRHLDIFACPGCGGDLRVTGERPGIQCTKCNHFFECKDGLPLLFWPNEWEDRTPDVTDRMRSFYEKTPFPNYENLDDTLSLRKKALQGVFARLLNEQIPPDAKILEIGCGTGQLSNFLGMQSGRTVFATDISLNSLTLAHNFKEKNHIHNVVFFQMNLFKPALKHANFDVVICNGVLHHTSNPLLGFQTISKLVKKDGFVMVGLYNTYGRLSTDIKRFIFSRSFYIS
jgi:SAM-dependent methyltransferase